jgi:hypothetical protein
MLRRNQINFGDLPMTRGTLFVVAILAVAAVTTACRREVPHPMGLGAGDIAVKQSVQQ